MSHLRGASMVGRDDGGGSYAARTVDRRGLGRQLRELTGDSDGG